MNSTPGLKKRPEARDSILNEFSALPISAALKQRLAKANFITLTPVQVGAIPPALEGRDVLATAQTGTGKTLSFLIPIIEKLQTTQTKAAGALILLPTRELAMQVQQACAQLISFPTALVVGGMAEGPQLDSIRRGARLIVATPGRLEDFLGRKLVKLKTFEVSADRKLSLLEHLLRSEDGSFLVFVRTKHGAERVAKKLAHAGWKATSIHGDRSQSQRNAALRSFAQGGHRVLVATDVAARGIDVDHVAHVVNYDMPKVAEDFVHRVGRTGRASRSGVASTFASPEEKGDLRKIERALRINMQRFRVKDALPLAV